MTAPLTYLFTDIEGSSHLWDQFPEAMQLALAQHDAILQKAVERHCGRIVKTTGDGLYAVFESPSDGVAAALAGQQAITAASWPVDTGPLKVRMGLHTGESQARAGDYFGSEVNQAARIMGLAYGGQVLISGITAELVKKTLPQGCTLMDLGEHRLKGIAASTQIFQLSQPYITPEFPPLKSLDAFKHNLHRQLSSFIGREAELADVKRLLQNTHLLTLLGPGGTGKTRLMLQAAEEIIEDFPDGVWLVELASTTDPDLITGRVAAVFNLHEQPGRQMIDLLIEYLRRKELLLLLDNVEHFVRECAEFAEHLLGQCPKLKILVTGREALFIEGETTLQIPSLSMPKSHPTLGEIAKSEGVQLFLARAQAVHLNFSLTEQNAGPIAEIVRRLDGIPLALELAASRLRMLTVDQIVARLNDRFRLLTGGRRTALPRQQTLQALIDWSWNLLDEEERILLRRLSVFSGGWALDAAQAVTGFHPLDALDVFDELQQLINKSMVIVRYPPEGEARYTMLESIHQYAQDRLFEAGESETLRDRHVDHYVSLIDEFDKVALEQDFFAWMNRFSYERDNLLAVLSWIAEDRPQLALHYAGILFQFDPTWLPYREARSWLEPIVVHARELFENPPTAPVRKDFIKGLQSLGWLLVTHGDMVAGHAVLDECIQLARESGELRILVIALSMKMQAMGATVTQEIIEQLEEIVVTCRQKNYDVELTMALFSLGGAYLARDHLEKGQSYFAEVIRRTQKHDVPFITAWVCYVQALMAQAAQNYAQAEKYYLLTMDINQKFGNQRLVATARSELAHLYRRTGRLDEALAYYRQSIFSWQEQGHLSAVAHELECFAFIAIARKQYQRAAHLLGAAHWAREQLNELSTDPQEIAELKQALDQLNAGMGETGRERAFAEGAQMSLDEGVILAMNGVSAVI